MEQVFDVIVIGAGPGGYTAALRAAQLGKKVACIDASCDAAGRPAPGGTCTNVGCIPSKALLQSSEYFEQASKHFSGHGIQVSGLGMDAAAMVERKDKVVAQNNAGILYLFKKNKVQFFHGTGSFVAAQQHDGTDGYVIQVRPVAADAAPETLFAPQVVVATGSSPRALPGAAFDETFILSNTGALQMTVVPQTLGVIGAGVIGLEMGSVWRRLGAEVTLLEALPDFLGTADAQIVRDAKRAFDRQGLKIALGVQVGAVTVDPQAASGAVQVAYTNAKGEAQTLVVDRLVVSIGRVPHTQGLNAEAVGLALDGRGAVVVDDACRTNLPGVWAVGDVVRGPMLAHKAEHEGVAVAERIAGQHHGPVDFNLIPWVIYTSPEIAWVGKTEQQLKEAGIQYKAGTFPFMANGRARAMGETAGMVKFLADAETDEILGVHIVGPMASELIAEACVAMALKARSADIAGICHAHPSLSEAMKEAAVGVTGKSLNM